ncbi:hypothetical protein [Hugenholtzia roseola]|uniref:hypothetical protein n=1 Tax=Hugenholtzia roseola TaxID=1002 RepID=UPI00047D4AD8|nr:hypothetical protein [Hugenholtzia roseola]
MKTPDSKLPLENQPPQKPDLLERFVLENRTEFDGTHALPNLWSKIEQELEKEALAEKNDPTKNVKSGAASNITFSLRLFMSMAASVLILITAGIWYHFDKVNEKEIALAELSQKAENLDAQLQKIAPELLEAESFYQYQIKKQTQAFVQLASRKETAQPELKAETLAELAQLDSAYTDMKAELLKEQNPKIIEALLENLRIRKQILEQSIEIIETIQADYESIQPKEKEEKRETSPTLSL